MHLMHLVHPAFSAIMPVSRLPTELSTRAHYRDMTEGAGTGVNGAPTSSYQHHRFY